MSVIDWLGKSAYLLAIGGSGIFIASLIISRAVSGYNIVKIESPLPEKTDEEYDKKYLEELKEVESRVLLEDDLKILKTKIVEEETPIGLIKMYYDHDYKGFIWFSDRSSAPYRFLETVVRKYIIEHDCCNLYVDLYEEVSKSHKLARKASDTLSSRSKSIFVEAKNNNEQLLKLLSIKTNYLRFKYGGKLEDYKTKNEPDTYSMIDIDFATYKHLKEKSN